MERIVGEMPTALPAYIGPMDIGNHLFSLQFDVLCCAPLFTFANDVVYLPKGVTN